jgi:hypothetical protein
VPEQDPVLVDTDVASALYLERFYDPRVSATLAAVLATRRSAISLITLGESHYGVRKRKWGPPRTSRMLAFYQEMFDVVPLADEGVAAEYGYLGASTESVGQVGQPLMALRTTGGRMTVDSDGPLAVWVWDAGWAKGTTSGGQSVPGGGT